MKTNQILKPGSAPLVFDKPTFLEIHVGISDVVEVMASEGSPFTREHAAQMWAEAIETKSRHLGSLANYLLKFMDKYKVEAI